MNLEAHGGGDEAVILLVEDVIHLERTAVLDVSVASQFDSVNLVAEGEGGVLERDAGAELAV